MKPRSRSKPASDSAIVAKAAIRAAERLGLTSRALARVLGLSESTISRMRTGDYPLPAGQKPFEIAVMFVRLYRSLDAIVGGDDKVAGEWLRNKNTAFNARPLDLIQSVTGLVNVVQYLDARRALI